MDAEKALVKVREIKERLKTTKHIDAWVCRCVLLDLLDVYISDLELDTEIMNEVPRD